MRTFVVSCLLLVVAASARATMLVPTDLGEMSKHALAIVRGRVSALDARWTDDHRTIETTVTLDAENYLKGGLGTTVQFRVPGGELGRYRSIVVGAPEFSVGQRVVVFLGARGPSVPYLIGFSQGVFRVVLAADNSGWIVTPPGIMPSTAGPIVRGDPSRRTLALADFESRVRALAGSAR